MARQLTGRPVGRPKTAAPNDAPAYVRMTAEQRQTIERACAKVVEDEPMAVQPSVATWLLRAGLAAAKDVLGA